MWFLNHPEVDQQLGMELVIWQRSRKRGLRGRSAWECGDGNPDMTENDEQVTYQCHQWEHQDNHKEN